MELKKLTIEGFRSFKKRQTLDFSGLKPGLYHVAGVNEVDQDLEANGAGKSSLFEAVYWALYGKTSRNLKADNVKAWEYKGPCRVRLEFEQGIVERGRGSKGITLDVFGKPGDQQTLDKKIGLSPDAFLHTAYQAQFSPSFVDLSPASRMDLYAEIMQLGLWEEKSKQAALLARDFSEEVAQLKERVAGLEGSINALRGQDFKALENDWEAEREERGIAKREEIDKVKESINRLQNEVKEANLRAVEMERASNKARVELEALQNKVETAVREAATAEAAYAQINRKRDSLRRQLNTLEPGVCSACGQRITKEYVKQHHKHLLAEFEQTEDEAKRVRDEMRKHTALLHAAKEKLSAKRDMTPDSTAAIGMAAAVNKDLEQAQSLLLRLREEYKRIKEETNPWTGQRRNTEGKLKTCKRELDKTLEDLKWSAWHQAAFEFWSKRMKDIRFFLIQESLTQLNLEVNESLEMLGLVGWALECLVESESKSGTIRRGFQITVSSPVSQEKNVPWEAWSGGESQRLRLAVQLGVSNMLSARAGVDHNFEFWDEPSTWLSNEGIKDLLHVLEERAKQYRRVILLADHRVLDYPFAGTITVTKTDDGSSINAN